MLSLEAMPRASSASMALMLQSLNVHPEGNLLRIRIYQNSALDECTLVETAEI